MWIASWAVLTASSYTLFHLNIVVSTTTSILRVPPDHGINANMLHKWRRAHIAGVVSIKPFSQPAFLVVSLAPAASTVFVKLPVA